MIGAKQNLVARIDSGVGYSVLQVSERAARELVVFRTVRGVQGGEGQQWSVNRDEAA